MIEASVSIKPYYSIPRASFHHYRADHGSITRHQALLGRTLLGRSRNRKVKLHVIKHYVPIAIGPVSARLHVIRRKRADRGARSRGKKQTQHIWMARRRTFCVHKTRRVCLFASVEFYSRKKRSFFASARSLAEGECHRRKWFTIFMISPLETKKNYSVLHACMTGWQDALNSFVRLLLPLLLLIV